MTDVTRRDLLAGIAGVGAIPVSGCLSRARAGLGGTPGDDDPGGGDAGSDAGIADASVRTDDAGCGSPDDDAVSVAVTGDTIAVDGVLPAPDPCHEAVLDDASLEGDVLSVVIDVAETTSGDEGCVMCHGAVEYLAEIERADASEVESVMVDHATGERHAADVEADPTPDPGEDPTPGPREDPSPGQDEDPTTDPEGDPAVDDPSIETVDAGCGSGADEVDVGFGEETVTVSGTLPAPNPCHEAVLETVAVENDRLSVVVDARSTLADGEGCVGCLGAISYEAVIGLPAPAGITEVAVDHATGGESTVAR